MAQSKKPISETDTSKKQDYKILLTKFEEDLISLKRNSREYTKSVQMLQANMKGLDETLKKDKQAVKMDFQALVDSVVATNEILAGRQNLMADTNLGLQGPQKSAASN